MTTELKRLKRRIRYLFSTKYKTSIAPRKAIAEALKTELTNAGIVADDHLLFVMNTVNT